MGLHPDAVEAFPDRGVRATALAQAIILNTVGGRREAVQIIDQAREFEKFLRGSSSPPELGLATTSSLLLEIIARLQDFPVERNLAIDLRHRLSPQQLAYRAVDS